MSDTPLLDIDNVPAENQADLAAKLRELLRFADLDVVTNSTAIVALKPDNSLALIGPDDIPVAKFASGITPVEIVGALPSTGNFVGRVVFLTTDKKLYRYDGTTWSASVPAVDITGQLTDTQIAAIAAAKILGQIVAAQIADAAITTAKFAAGLKPVEVVSTLPTTGNTAGRMVFLTSDNKLYRYNGTAFVATVAATDLTGQITGTQITDGAISTPKLAAGSVTATQIAANTITAAQIAADTITAGQIAAAAITASELAAGAVIAGKIAAGIITANEIAAATITGAKIAAATITAANILAGTITANEIAAATITGAKIAANTITAANIAADTITAGQIAAAAIGASEIAANAITAEKLSVGLRNLDLSGIEFSIAGNVLSWTAGTIQYTDDTGADASASISSGSVTWSTGKVYVYWAKAGTVLSTTTAYATAHTANNVILGVYEGGDNWNPKAGRTVIAGSKIRTGSIAADKLTISSLAAISAVLGSVDISSAIIGTLTVGTLNIANGAVTDTKTDQTAPGAPGTPALASVTADLDSDGTLDTGLIATWSPPGSGRAPKKYYIEVYRRKGDKGTDGNNVTGYSLWSTDTISSVASLYAFKANANYFHKMRVTPLSANDVAGTASAYTTVGVKPALPSGSVTAPTGAYATSVALGIQVGWDISPDLDYAYTEVGIIPTSPPTQPTIGAPFITPGNIYLGADGGVMNVWFRHVNRSGQKSTWVYSGETISPGKLDGSHLVSNSIAGLQIAGDSINTGNIVDNAVDTNQIANGAVTFGKINNPTSVIAQASVGLSAGGLGTYATLKKLNAGTAALGDVVSGSNLAYTDSSLATGTSPTGTTWQSMGRCAQNQASTWLRVS